MNRCIAPTLWLPPFIGALLLSGLVTGCDTTVPIAGKPCVVDDDCVDLEQPDRPHFCAPTEPPVCLPGAPVPPRENRAPIVQATTVVATAGGQVVATVNALDPDGDVDLDYRLVFSSSSTGIIALLDPALDDVAPGTFRFQATSDVPTIALTQSFEVVVTDSLGAEGAGSIFTVVINPENLLVFEGEESSVLTTAENWAPVNAPTADSAVFFPPETPFAPNVAEGAELGAVYLANAVAHDLTGASIFGEAVFSASRGTGTVRLESAADVAGRFPSLQVTHGLRAVDAIDAVDVFIASAGQNLTTDRVDLRTASLTVGTDLIQTTRAAPIVMRQEGGRRPSLRVGGGLRLEGGRNIFESGDLYVGRALRIAGDSFRPASQMRLNFVAADGPAEVRIESSGSYLPTTVVDEAADVSVFTSTSVNGDLDVDGAFSVFRGAVLAVRGTLILRRHFRPGAGPFGELRANRCESDPYVEIPPWITCLGLPFADAGTNDDGGPPPSDAGQIDSGVADAGERDGGPSDSGPIDAGLVDGGNDDGGLLDGGPGDGGLLDGGDGDGGLSDGGLETDGGLAAALPPCVSPTARHPGFIANLLITEVAPIASATTFTVQVDPALLGAGAFVPLDAELADGAFHINSAGVVTLTNPSLAVDVEVGLEVTRGAEPSAFGCLFLKVVDAEGANLKVLSGTNWNSGLSWRQGVVPTLQDAILVANDQTAANVGPDITTQGHVMTTLQSVLQGVPNQGGFPGLAALGGMSSSGLAKAVLVEGPIAGRFGVVTCQNTTTLTANVVAERFTSQTPGSSGVCSLYLGEHRLTVTGDFNVFGAVTLDHPLATLDVRGNLSIDSPASIIELTQGTLRAGGNVTFLASSGTGQPSIALILDGNGQQRIMVPSVIALEATSGDVTASVDVAANIAVSGLFSLARPISFLSPALTVTTSFVRFEAGYVSAGNEPQILADSCDASGYLATQPPGAIDPCQDVFAP